MTKIIYNIAVFSFFITFLSATYAADSEIVHRCVSTFDLFKRPISKALLCFVLVWTALYIALLIRDKYKNLYAAPILQKFYVYIICYGIFLVTIISTNFITYFIFQCLIDYAIYVSVFAIALLLLKYTEKYNRKHVQNLNDIEIFRFCGRLIISSVLLSFVFSYVYWVQVLYGLAKLILKIVYPAAIECL